MLLEILPLPRLCFALCFAESKTLSGQSLKAPIASKLVDKHYNKKTPRDGEFVVDCIFFVVDCIF